MKLSIFFLCLSVLTVVANGTYSQTTKLSLQMENTSIESILGHIEQETEYRFFYTEKLGIDAKVSIDLNKSSTSVLLKLGRY